VSAAQLIFAVVTTETESNSAIFAGWKKKKKETLMSHSAGTSGHLSSGLQSINSLVPPVQRASSQGNLVCWREGNF